MTCDLVCSEGNTTGATFEAGSAYLSPLVFNGVRSLAFCAVLCVSLFVLSPVVILLSVLQQFTASDYPFGIFKLHV